MNYWIFQTSSKYYADPNEFEDQQPDWWFVNPKSRGRLAIGDAVYFCESGENARMHGWAIITGIQDSPTNPDDPQGDDPKMTAVVLAGETLLDELRDQPSRLQLLELKLTCPQVAFGGILGREAMEELAGLIGRSPRAMKRFVNVYRLIRASLPHDELPLFAGTGKVRGRSRAPMFLLAVSVGMPRIAVDLLTGADENDHPLLPNVLDRLIPNSDNGEEWNRLQQFRESPEFDEWKNLTTSDLLNCADRVMQYSFNPPLAPAINVLPTPTDPEPATPEPRRAKRRGRSK